MSVEQDSLDRLAPGETSLYLPATINEPDTGNSESKNYYSELLSNLVDNALERLGKSEPEFRVPTIKRETLAKLHKRYFSSTKDPDAYTTQDAIRRDLQEKYKLEGYRNYYEGVFSSFNKDYKDVSMATRASYGLFFVNSAIQIEQGNEYKARVDKLVRDLEVNSEGSPNSDMNDSLGQITLNFNVLGRLVIPENQPNLYAYYSLVKDYEFMSHPFDDGAILGLIMNEIFWDYVTSPFEDTEHLRYIERPTEKNLAALDIKPAC